MMRIKQISWRLLFGLLLSILAHSARGEAQVENFPELDLPTLAQRAESLSQSKPGEAIPYMVEIKGRLTGAMSEEFRGIYRENLYMLGLAHMRWFEQTGDPAKLAAGIPYWNEFLDEFQSDKRHRLAMLNLADSHFGADQWSAAVKRYRHVLDIYALQLDDEDLKGVLERLVVAAKRLEERPDLKPVLEPFLDGDFPVEVRLFALNTLFDRALKADDLEDLMNVVQEINRERSFRYDLGINLRLLNVGDRFEDAERYLEAGLLFSMVLPIETLLRAVEDRLIEVEERLFRRQFITSDRPQLDGEREALRTQRKELAEAPRYTANLRWRQARVLRLMGRKFEAYFGFKRLIEDFPQHEHVEQFRYAGFLQALECDYPDEAVAMGETYLAEPSYVLFEKPIAIRMATLYRKRGAVEKLATLADTFLHRFPYEPIAAKMVHSLGQAYFNSGDTEAILDRFPFWAEEFPDGAFIDSVRYWSGMAYLFVGQFEPALSAFEALIERNPGSVYLAEARFRRGVAHFGLGNYTEAREIFEAWVAAWQKHPLQAEAHVFLGDLDAMDARVEAALANYAEVEELGGAQALVDHAYFESASLLLANERYDAHSELLEQYLDQYPKSPAAAEAILRLAEAELEQDRVGRAFERYEEGIRRFGHRVETDHVDRLIDAWWENYEAIARRHRQTAEFMERLASDEAFRSEMLYDRVAQLGWFAEHKALPKAFQALLSRRSEGFETLARRTAKTPPYKGLEVKLLEIEAFSELHAEVEAQFAQLPEQTPAERFLALRQDALDAGQRALALRLRRVLNLRGELEVSPAQLGEAELAIASPATRVWIARIEAREDSVLARDILDSVLQDAPMSEAAADALFLLGELEMEDGYFDRAATAFGRLLEDFFTDPRAPVAALRRGDALRLARRFEEAMAAYTEVLNHRDWRGPVWAEATFKMGLCFVELGDTGKAQGFFERTYIAFSGYPEWAGKAVLESAELLVGRGDLQSARETYRFFLDLPQAGASPLEPVIRRKMEAL